MTAFAKQQEVVPELDREELLQVVCTLSDELDDTKSENNRLKEELEQVKVRPQLLPGVDLCSLRRHVAFFVHPDRGGDADLMSRLNVLFDRLAQLNGRTDAGGDLCRGGVAR